MSACTTISYLRSCFAKFGIPVSVVSDNGPCFVSSEFDNFVRLNGIKHIKTAVYKPSTNGLAENMVKSFKDYLKTNGEGTLQETIDKFLFRYRVTPHTTTGVSPAKLMFGRELRTIFDLLKPSEIKDRVKAKQRKQKFYRDPKVPRTIDVSPHDSVYVRNYNSNSKWKSGKVIKQTGPLSHKCEVDNKIVKRHQDQLITVTELNNAESVDVPSDVPDTSVTNITPTVIEPRRSDRIRRPPDRLNL